MRTIQSIAAMEKRDTPSSRLPGFHKMTIEARRAALAAAGRSSFEGADLSVPGLSIEAADHMIENVVGDLRPAPGRSP